MNLEVVNIVATAKLSAPLNLQQLANMLENAEMSSHRWLKMRLPPENYYVAFYKSGKFLITGVKSIDAMKDVAERVLHILRSSGLKITCESIIIHNIVMVGSVKLYASLEKIIYSLDSSKVSYEPEQFTGLIYRDFGVSFLLFPSGKVVVTGVKDIYSGESITDKFRNIIEGIH